MYFVYDICSTLTYRFSLFIPSIIKTICISAQWTKHVFFFIFCSQRNHPTLMVKITGQQHTQDVDVYLISHGPTAHVVKTKDVRAVQPTVTSVQTAYILIDVVKSPGSLGLILYSYEINYCHVVYQILFSYSLKEMWCYFMLIRFQVPLNVLTNLRRTSKNHFNHKV